MSPIDFSFASPNPPPRQPRQPQPGQLLFAFYRERDHKFFRCELRDHGKWGVEAQFFDPVDLIESHRFDDMSNGERMVKARELAIAWAHEERKAIDAFRGSRRMNQACHCAEGRICEAHPDQPSPHDGLRGAGACRVTHQTAPIHTTRSRL